MSINNQGSVAQETKPEESTPLQFNGMDLPDPATIDIFGTDPAPVTEPEVTADDNPEDFIPDGPEAVMEDNSATGEDNLLEDFLPDKFRGKSKEDIVKSYEELESKLGEQSLQISTRKKDLETHDLLMQRVNGPNGIKTARLLDAILRDDFSSLDSDFSSPSSKDEYSDDFDGDGFSEEIPSAVNKKLNSLENMVKQLTEQLSSTKPAIQHSQEQLNQQKTMQAVGDAAKAMQTRHNIKMDPKEMVEFGQKYKAKYNFRSWDDVAHEYAAVKLRQADAIRRDANKEKNKNAPVVNKETSQEVYTPGAKYGKWSDLSSSIAEQLSKLKIV